MKKKLIILISRKDYIKFVKSNLEKQFDAYDECRLWLNTNKEQDFYIDYFKDNQKVKIVVPEESNPDVIDPFVNLKFFYKQDAVDENSVYIKLDDDILWVEENFIDKLFSERLKPENDKYFLILPLIFNNAIISNILMRFGKLPWDNKCWYNPQDPIGWGSGYFAEKLHRMFLDMIKENALDSLKFNKWLLDPKELVTINAISFFGSDMKNVVPTLNMHSDEFYLCHYGPSILNKNNIIVGNNICSHYAFFPQKNYLDTTDILQLYENII